MTARVTVALCTRNRAGLLASALERLAGHWVPLRDSCELLVVDNDSHDATPRVLQEAHVRWGVRALHEPRAGLSHARNAAVAAAEGEWVVFTDDDVVWSPGWLQAWLDAVRVQPVAGWMGGPVRPLWEGSRPRWARDETLPFLQGVLVRHDLARDDGPYAQGEPWPVGANFALRRSSVATVGPFRADLGHQGAQRGLGEETDWLRRAVGAGLGGWYVSRAAALHPVDRQRLRLAPLFRHGVASGVAETRMNPGREPGTLWGAGWALARGLRQACLGRGDRFRQCVVNAGIEVGARREQRQRRRAGLPGPGA